MSVEEKLMPFFKELLPNVDLNIHFERESWTKNWQLGLQKKGAGSRPFFCPLSALSAFRNTPEAAHAQDTNPAAYSIGSCGETLPSAHSLTQADLTRAVSILKRSIG